MDWMDMAKQRVLKLLVLLYICYNYHARAARVHELSGSSHVRSSTLLRYSWCLHRLKFSVGLSVLTILIRIVYYISFSRYRHGKIEMQLGTYLCPFNARGGEKCRFCCEARNVDALQVQHCDQSFDVLRELCSVRDCEISECRQSEFVDLCFVFEILRSLIGPFRQYRLDRP